MSWSPCAAFRNGRAIPASCLRGPFWCLTTSPGISWLFWRGETGAAWEFHGSDGSAGAPWLSIHLCRCGLAVTVCLGVGNTRRIVAIFMLKHCRHVCMQRGLARALSAAKPKYDFLPLRRELHLVLCNVDKRRMQGLPRTPVISIVDDDASVRAAANRLVRSLGYVAYPFASAREFLESSQVNDTSCLIADVQMPAMSGLELH